MILSNKAINFTEHQLNRMAKRGISKDIVFKVLKSGEWSKGKNPSSFEVIYKGIIVVLYAHSESFNVVTCKLDRENTIKAEKLMESLQIDFFKACHKVIKSIEF